MPCRLYPPCLCLWHAKKVYFYAWIMHCWIVNWWIVYRELAQTNINTQKDETQGTLCKLDPFYFKNLIWFIPPPLQSNMMKYWERDLTCCFWWTVYYKSSWFNKCFYGRCSNIATNVRSDFMPGSRVLRTQIPYIWHLQNLLGTYKINSKCRVIQEDDSKRAL